MLDNFIKVGHRGASGYEPENTLISFKKALELEVDMVELDVYTLKDGHTVVFHDDTLDRTTDGEGFIMDKTFNEIRELDAGKKEKIPTLEEVLDFIAKRVQVNIELKGEKTAKPIFELIERYVKEYGWSYDSFLVSSFNYQELKDFRKLNKIVRIGILFSKPVPNYNNLVKELGAYFVGPDKTIVDKDFIKDTHKRGLKIFVWTVNNVDEINALKLLGVDGIISDYPDRL